MHYIQGIHFLHDIHVTILFAIVLGIMVLIHELGHFAVAKWCGVRVETFSIGFGTRLFGFRRGDTDYRISLLPLGGYVKMAGDVPGEAASGDPGEFNAHPRWHRTLIALAGPIANFILSFVLLVFVGLYHHEVDVYLDNPAIVDYVPTGTAAANAGLTAGDLITSFNGHANPTWFQVFEECSLNQNRAVPYTFLHDGHSVSASLPCNLSTNTNEPPSAALAASGLLAREQTGPVSVFSVAPNTPADRAGLKAGDLIVSIDNLQAHSADPALVDYLHDRNGAPAVLKVLRNGQTLTMVLTPEKMPGQNGDVGYRLGFTNEHAPTKVVHLGFGAAVKQSFTDNLDDASMTFRVLKGLFTRHVSVKALSGPVGIAQQIDAAAQNGPWSLVRFTSFISLQLGIFNLLPIPILDGGMILFLAIESLMRRDLNQQIKERVYQLAFVCLIMFAVFVFYNDLTRQ
jgi:regulator of sigma E protease